MLSLGILHNLEDYRQNVNAVSALRRCQKLPEYPPSDLPLALPSVLLHRHFLPTACSSLQVPKCSLLSCTVRCFAELFHHPNHHLRLPGKVRLVKQLQGYSVWGSLSTFPERLNGPHIFHSQVLPHALVLHLPHCPLPVGSKVCCPIELYLHTSVCSGPT